MACHTPMPFFLPVSPVSEHAENNWHVTFLTLLQNPDRASITYCHLHVILNSSHVWEHLPNIPAPQTGQKSISLLFHSLLITIRPARFLLLCVSVYVCIFLSCFMFIIEPLCYLANLATIKYTYIQARPLRNMFLRLVFLSVGASDEAWWPVWIHCST